MTVFYAKHAKRQSGNWFFMEAIWCQNQTIDSTNISLCFIFDSLAINKIA